MKHSTKFFFATVACVVGAMITNSSFILGWGIIGTLCCAAMLFNVLNGD